MNINFAALVVTIGMFAGGPVQTQGSPPNHQLSDVYVSVRGTNNNQCTLQRPCSLQGAQTFVRTVKLHVDSDITVHIAPGTYQLDAPLQFTSEDSGVQGHTIIWKRGSEMRPILSGGVRVSGWQQVPGKPWLWRTNVPAGRDRIRNLWFNGKRAVPVRAPGCDEQGCKYLPVGVTTPNTAMAAWKYQQDIMAVGFDDWRDYHCGIRSIDSKSVVLSEACWKNVNAVSDQNDFLGWHVTTPKDGKYWRGFNWFENVYDALSPSSAGQFFHDPSSGALYYVPRAGEHPGDAIAPASDALIVINGAKNLRFEGLQFSYTDWRKVDSQSGYAGTQAGFSNDDDHDGAAFPSDGSTWTKMAAAVQVEDSRNIDFIHDDFDHLGAAGLTLGGSSSHNIVDGCHFTDISGNGLQIGDVDQDTINHRHPLESEDRITNNVIDNIGQEFRDSIGIWTGYVYKVLIDHNTLHDLPYTGISVGWGWGLDFVHGPTGAGENQITNNRIVHTMMTLKDGGAIYTQGSQPNSVVAGNYVDDVNGYGKGIYLDEESMHIDAYGNVITNATGFWLSMWSHHNDDLNVHDNYTDSTRLSNGNPHNTIANNHTGLKALPEAAIMIAEQAGAPLTKAAPRPFPIDCALMKPAMQSSTREPVATYGAFRGNDGDDDGHETLSHPAETTGSPSDPNPWWEVDLGRQTDIDTIQIFNQEVYESVLRNFTLYVSENPFTDNDVQHIRAQSVFVYHYDGVPNVRTDIPVNHAGRYIRLRVSGARKLILVELKVFASESVPDR